jgi:hypothetical protein
LIKTINQYVYKIFIFSDNVDDEPSTASYKPQKNANFGDVFKKKYGARQPSAMKKTTTETPITAKVTYPPKPTPTRSKYTRFVPTPRSFLPKFPRVRTTLSTTSTTTATTTTTSRITSTNNNNVISSSSTKKSSQKYPEPSLETSMFGGGPVGEPQDAVFDLEKVPSTNSMSIDTSSFELDSMNFDDGSLFASSKQQQQVKLPIISVPSTNSAEMSKVPIRKVLDIFQELRLSFGRDQ